MPKEIADKIIWLFLLAPGFLSISLIRLIVDLGELSEFQITFYSLVLTLIDIAVAVPIYWGASRILRKFEPTFAAPEAAKYTFGFVTLVVSIVVGIFLGLMAEQDRLFLVLRKLPLTDVLNKRSSSRTVVFLLSQNTTGRLKQEGDARPASMKQTEAWALVLLKDGKKYEGWPEFYEINRTPSEIYLSPACEIVDQPETAQTVLRPIPGPGVIVYESEIQSIELLDRPSSRCSTHWASLVQQGTPASGQNKTSK
ncbi:MAG: hypothetical protein JWM26_481 [Betaproteobacteria bacterium]|nr:hypothetical protein [Betaproteobacteria bacterium]